MAVRFVGAVGAVEGDAPEIAGRKRETMRMSRKLAQMRSSSGFLPDR